ncbi:MAG TPA: hypothetical protein VLI41_07415 [Phenylobacterium sp.]|uniref:hypothetical protein n=1 Tax=Phenylobacterium sp. TaxID=1871053 RepID=UPI002B8572A7|nr:hypothetical protein [Phenylobacterium sp.]HSV03022.1 hypothetical protein [Phenylobacterium sp.]
MVLRSKVLPAALAAAALAAPLAARSADLPTREPGSHVSCFLRRDWAGWSAPGDGDVLYLRVGNREVWRVGLTPGTHVHKDPGYFLVARARGSSWVCGPLDLDLSLSDSHGFRQGLIATSLRKLTPAETAVIPKKDLPG